MNNMMNEIAILILMVECLILGVFSYLIVITNKKQQMMVNGLSHVWGQLNQINLMFMRMIETKKETNDYLEHTIADSATDDNN